MFTLRKSKTEAPPQANRAADRAHLLARLLLVVDGSEPSIAAANVAMRLSVEFGSAVTAAYIVDTATMDYLLQMHIFVDDERLEFERDLEATGRRYLDYVKTIAANQHVEVETILRKGSFHKNILELSRTLGVDAIVLGGWKRTVTRKDSASVERQLILDEADCPVLVVKSA